MLQLVKNKMEIAGINKCEKCLKVDVSYSFSRIKVRLSIV